MAKNKTFVLSDESLNSYGFRVLTDGIDVEQFKKNPVMLFMHNRPWRGTKDEYTVIGRWEKIRKENGQLLADAVFDDNDDFAKKIAAKVEGDFLRMSSLGFNLVETSSDPKHLLPGQRYETVTKCTAKEGSIVDIGSNNNALALCDVPALYDEHDALVTLTAGSNPVIPSIEKNNTDMSELKQVAVALKLADNATPENILSAVQQLQEQAVTLADEKQNLAAEVQQLKAAAVAEKITALVDSAVADKKITAAQKEHFIKLATGDFESTKAILDSMPAYTSLKGELEKNEQANEAELNELLKLSGTDLFKRGKLERLKTLSMPHFKTKYKEAFNKEYAEPKPDPAV